MKKQAGWLAAFMVICLCAVSAKAQAPRFSSSVDGLPLLTGLAETPDSFVFDSPEGRVARLIAEGGVAPADVAQAYAEALPALGWRFADADLPANASSAELQIMVFDRHAERLTLIITQPAPGRTRALFDLRPAWTF